MTTPARSRWRVISFALISACSPTSTPSLKRKLAAVHGTYVTTNRRLPLRLALPDGERRVTLSVVDTMLLAPPKSSLAIIGEQLATAQTRNHAGLLDRGDGALSH